MKTKLYKFIFPIIIIIFGLLIAIFKDAPIKWITSASGVIITVCGIVKLMKDIKNKDDINNKRNLTIDGVIILLGLSFAIFSWFAVSVFRVLFGIVFLFVGISKIISSLISSDKNRLIYNVIIGAIYTVIGFLLFFNKDIIYIILGVLLIIDGIGDVINTYFEIKQEENNAKKKNRVIIDADIN